MAETFKANHVALTTSNQDIVPAVAASTQTIASKIVLETGDKIQALASAASDVEIFVSYLEIT